MIRYTTPTDTLTVKGIDLTEMDVYVTFKQKQQQRRDPVVVTLADTTVSYADGDSKIQITLTQQQTSSFKNGPAQVQVNWIDQNGLRGATREANIVIHDNLLQEVLTYGG